jgi:glucose/arabinose dehydrogenase
MEVVTMMTLMRRLSRWSVALLVLAVASRADALSGGVTTLSFGVNGCNECHTGGNVPTVSLTGPTVVAPDSTNEYTLEIVGGGAQTLAGLNVSALIGVLATGGADSTDTQTLSGTGGRAEITHTMAKPAVVDTTTFSFLWTAPSSFTNVSLEAWGNSVNGNFSTSGDRAAHTSLLVSAVGAPTPTSSSTPTPASTPPGLANPLRPVIRKGRQKIQLTSIATGLVAPVWATGAPGVDPKFLFTVDQTGTLWRIDVTNGTKSVFLDVSARLIPLGVFGPGSYDERGFLGVAFDPDYATNGLLYTFTSEPATGTPDFTTLPPATPANCQSVIIEWHAPNPTDPGATVDTGSARELLRLDKPQFNHNGGGLVFGSDGFLYVSLGDGGGADDQDGQPFIGGPTVGHGATGNAQNLGAILGKILRVDPHGNNSANGNYGIPATNPFVATPGALGEIWAYGLRNPFRFSFDSATHALYVGDVGQNSVEEVDVITPGGNYGWKFKEGKFFFHDNGVGTGYVDRINNGVPTNLIDPIAEYDHDEGLAVIGGFVYRGTQFPRLVGHYVFGDFARTFSNDGRLFYLSKRDVFVPGHKLRRSRIAEFRLVGQDTFGMSLLGIGQDSAGEIYALANSTGTPGGTTGVVLRLSPAP